MLFRHLSAALLYPLAEQSQGRQIRAKVRTLRKQLDAPFAMRRRWVQMQMADMLDRAGCEVPYYRDLFKSIRFQPGRIDRDLAYLRDIPYLTKDIIREQGPRLISEKANRDRLHVRKTGGSTGPSTQIYYSQKALDWTAAVNLVCHQWAGKTRAMTELHFSSRFPEQFPWQDRLRERIKCLVLNRVNLHTDSLDEVSLERWWQQIRRTRPHLVQGHPSTLYALAVYLRGKQIDARRTIRVFESTGEVLDAKKRATIEGVFACRAIDRYGSAEFGVLAYEHINQPDRRLQVVDCHAWPETCPHESGGQELVFTALRNEAMPLVRYRTGDLAELESSGEGFFIRAITGRVHDVVRIGRDSYPTHYLQDLLDRLGGIDEFQVAQRQDKAVLRLVVPDVEHRQVISRRIQQWWPTDLELEFTDFDGLTREGWRNKFRYLVAS